MKEEIRITRRTVHGERILLVDHSIDPDSMKSPSADQITSLAEELRIKRINREATGKPRKRKK